MSRNGVLGDWGTTILLLGVPFFGSAFFRYQYELDSLTPGLAGACMLMVASTFVGLLRRPSATAMFKNFRAAFAIVAILVLHLAIASAFGDVNLVRSALSLFPVILIICTAPIIRANLSVASDESVTRMIRIMFAGFVVVGLNGLFGFQPKSGLASEKAVFPFTEPSHFALAFVPFAIFLAVQSNLIVRYGVLSILLFFALTLQNISLIAGAVLAGFASLAGWQLFLFVLSSGALLSFLDLSYFTDRLDFSYTTQNLSTLVYIQGTELGQIAMERTYGWGIGFQQLGFTNLFTPTSDLIYRLLHDDLNLKDGGITAAKAIAELGLFGLILLAAYIFYMIKSLLVLRQTAAAGARLGCYSTLALASFVSFSIELFVRGAGYFTPGTLLLVTALPIVLQTALRPSALQR